MNTYKCRYKQYNETKTSYWHVVCFVLAESFDEAYRKIKAKKPNAILIDILTDREDIIM